MDKITVTMKLRLDIYNKMKQIALEQRRSITGQIEYVLLQWLDKEEVRSDGDR